MDIDANKIIDLLLEELKNLKLENTILKVQVEELSKEDKEKKEVK